jgi:thymidylate synthase (FAD)
MSHLDDLPKMTENEKANHEAKQARQNPSADRLLGLYFPVLDQGFVSLVDYMGNDAAIAQAARCSYGPGTRAVNDDRALIRYLVRHKHTSPLEQVELKFHCKMPIFVARQWVRHRTASLNEMSGRYSIMPLQFYTPDVESFKLQSKDNKQGRDDDGTLEQGLHKGFVAATKTIRNNVKKHYVECLTYDVAREIARIDLPLSTYTEWYWKMDLHNLMHFLRLRCDGHAQWEIRQYANIIAGIVQAVVPAAFEAWQDYVYEAETFTYQDMRLLQHMFGKHSSVPSEEEAVERGMSKREYREFQKKFLVAEKQDFTLRLDEAKPPSYFREQAEMCVPEIK